MALKNICQKYRSALDVIEGVERSVLIAIFLVIIMSVSLQVFCRYLLNNPLSWPEELSRFLLVWLSFVATSVLYRRKGHIAVETLVNLFNIRNRAVISGLLNLVILIFMLLVIHSGLGLQKIQVTMTTMSTLEIPKCYLTLALTASACSMALTAVYLILRDVSIILGSQEAGV